MKNIGALCVGLSLFLLLIFGVNESTAAQVNLRDLQVPIISGVGIFEILGRLLSFILILGGIIAFFYVLYGGFLYLTAGGDPARAQTGQRTIFNAVIGIIIISLSYTFVRFVVVRIKESPENRTSSKLINDNEPEFVPRR